MSFKESLKNFWRKYFVSTVEPKKRRFDGARLNRLTNDWRSSSNVANQILRMDLRQLRQRSRDLSKNDPYAKRFFQLCRTNIIGKGIQLQVHTSGTEKARDEKLTSKIEWAFYQWSKKETCTRSGKLTFVEALQLFVTQMARDGESLVRMYSDNSNKFGFSLKFYDADWLDETYSTILPNGNRIIMSVEVNEDDKPVAYWLTEPVGTYPSARRKDRTRFRVPAEEIIHSFLVTEGEEQARGIPWLHASMLRLFMLYGFEEAELEQKRVAACQMGFLVPPPDLNVESYNGEDGDETCQLEDIEPGQMQILKPGWDLKEFTPKVDNSIQDFRKSALRGAATGGGVSYHTLAGDLESVNYSSARIGSLDDRDFWRELQQKVIVDFCEKIYRRWLESSFLNGVLEITYAEFIRVQEPVFRGRGWAWVDPQKDMAANIEGLSNGIVTLTEVLAEQGKDPEDHFLTLKKEREMAAKYGIELPYLTNPKTANNKGNDQTNQTEPKRNLKLI